MADLLITGMEMPKSGEILNIEIGSNGQVNKVVSRDLRDVAVAKAQELPTHGRLIDEADLRDRAYKRQIRDRISFQDALALALMDAPTIIEASKERE